MEVELNVAHVDLARRIRSRLGSVGDGARCFRHEAGGGGGSPARTRQEDKRHRSRTAGLVLVLAWRAAATREEPQRQKR